MDKIFDSEGSGESVYKRDANDIESPKKFIKSWKTRRKISRILIFIGPVIAAIPIALSILDV